MEKNIARGVNEWDVYNMRQTENEGGVEEAGWVGP